MTSLFMFLPVLYLAILFGASYYVYKLISTPEADEVYLSKKVKFKVKGTVS